MIFGNKETSLKLQEIINMKKMLMSRISKIIENLIFTFSLVWQSKNSLSTFLFFPDSSTMKSTQDLSDTPGQSIRIRLSRNHSRRSSMIYPVQLWPIDRMSITKNKNFWKTIIKIILWPSNEINQFWPILSNPEQSGSILINLDQSGSFLINPDHFWSTLINPE